MTQSPTDTRPTRPKGVGRRERLESFVTNRIERIQRAYLDPANRARGGAELARLRHAASLDAGESPDTWMLEFDGFPEDLVGRDTEPSPGEWAAHLAFTLYAIHQQSNTKKKMHEPGATHSLGSAVRALVHSQKSDSSTPNDEVPSRFAALVTATEPSEIAHYARMLVRQLGSATPSPIPLDYRRLVGQLFDLRHQSRANQVRLQWGREYAQWRPESSDTESSDTGTPTTNQEGN